MNTGSTPGAVAAAALERTIDAHCDLGYVRGDPPLEVRGRHLCLDRACCSHVGGAEIDADGGRGQLPRVSRVCLIALGKSIAQNAQILLLPRDL